MLKEFKKFAIKGNMIDLAVGMIIGSAFNKIVSSLVNDIIMPLLGILTGKVDFANLFIALDGNRYDTLAAAEEVGTALIKYGQFITDVINFIVLMFIVFLFVREVNILREKKAAGQPAVEEAPTEKECPYCFTKISIKATKCPHCTADLVDKF